MSGRRIKYPYRVKSSLVLGFISIVAESSDGFNGFDRGAERLQIAWTEYTAKRGTGSGSCDGSVCDLTLALKM